MNRLLSIALLPLLAASPAWAEEDARPLDAAEIVRRAEDSLRGSTAQMKAKMNITTPRWKRELQYRSWDDRGQDRSFTRILAPKKDRGTGFLRLGNTLWTYLPRVTITLYSENHTLCVPNALNVVCLQSKYRLQVFNRYRVALME